MKAPLIYSLKTLKEDITIIDDSFTAVCDLGVSLTEVRKNKCIASVKDNKSPGNGGLTSEFYNKISEMVAPILVAVFKEATEKELLSIKVSLNWSQNQNKINWVIYQSVKQQCKNIFHGIC